MHISLEWTDNSSFGDHQVIQRKKAGESSFQAQVRLPNKASYYRDLGLEANTTYTYRISTVSEGVFSEWVETSARTDVNPHTKAVNVKDFGAIGDGKANDTEAIRSAIDAIYAEGGGTVYLPTGTYAVAPDKGSGSIFYLEHGNIFFKGDGPENTIISCYVHGMKDPETNWDYNANGKLVRGFCFALNTEWMVRNSNFIFEGLRVTGNTRPTGDTLWWTNEQMESGWDVSHKGLYFGSLNDNVLIRDTVWDGFRGEIIYSGDPWGGKLKLEDTKVYGTNSSAISTSADFECVNIEVWDAANTCIESAFFKDLSPLKQTQNAIFRNSIFRTRDVMLTDWDRNPLLTDDTTGHSALAIFNAPGTYMIIDSCTIENTNKWGVLMDVGQHNFTIIDTVFRNSAKIGAVYMETKDKEDYKLKGSVNNFLVEGCTFIASENSVIFHTTNYGPMLHKDMLFRNNKIFLNAGESIVHFDAHPHEGLRENLVFDGNEVIHNGGSLIKFSYDVKGSESPAIKPIWTDSNKFVIPTYFELSGSTEYIRHHNVEGPQNFVIHGPYVKIFKLPHDTLVELEMETHIDRYPEGFQTKIIRNSDQGRAVLRKNNSWNDFPMDLYMDKGVSIKLKKEDSIFRLKEINGHNVLSFRDRGYYGANPQNAPKVFSQFTGVAEGEQVVVAIQGEGVTIEHNDQIKLTDNKSFVHSGSPTELRFVRNGDVLIELDRQVCTRSLVRLD